MKRPLKILLIPLVLAARSVAADPIKTDGSDLGITIMGSIVQKTPVDNVALIKTGDGTVTAVKRDHVISDKYKVVAVTQQYIEVITRDSKVYFVYQDKFADSALQVKKVAAAPSNPALADTYREDGFERSKGKIKMTGMYRDKLVKEDLAKVLMQATAEPYMEGGQIVGFKMSQIDEGSIYQKSGVANGDIITAINGQELNSIAGSIALLRSLKGVDHVDVDVRRDGVTTKVSVDVN
jgi:type II secretion system protein C